jgi:hypothetical protein
MHGEWDEAVAEAQRACAWLTTPKLQPDAGPPTAASGTLWLRGDFERADSATGRPAGRAEAVSGLALLLAQRGKRRRRGYGHPARAEDSGRRARAAAAAPPSDRGVRTAAAARRPRASRLPRTWPRHCCAPSSRVGRVALAEGDPPQPGSICATPGRRGSNGAPYEAARPRADGASRSPPRRRGGA